MSCESRKFRFVKGAFLEPHVDDKTLIGDAVAFAMDYEID